MIDHLKRAAKSVMSVLAYPAILMMIIAGIYVFLRIEPGDRMRVFAMLAAASFGATELVVAVISVLRSQRWLQTAMHLLNGCGALLIGYSILNDFSLIPFVAGAALFSSGLLLPRFKMPTSA